MGRISFENFGEQIPSLGEALDKLPGIQLSSILCSQDKACGYPRPRDTRKPGRGNVPTIMCVPRHKPFCLNILESTSPLACILLLTSAEPWQTQSPLLKDVQPEAPRC